MEILTGVERRRRWSEEERLRILHEASLPGSSVAEVARRYDVSRSQIYQWRRAFRLRRAGSEVPVAQDRAPEDGALVDFLPVAISDTPQRNDNSDQAGVEKRASPPVAVLLAIGLRGGRTLHVSSSLASCEITRLIAAIEAAPEAAP